MKELGHVIQTQDFDRSWLEEKFLKEEEQINIILKKNPASLFEVLRCKKILLLFFEPNKRTSTLFQTAAHNLGAFSPLIEGSKIDGKWQIPYSSWGLSSCYEDLIVTYADYGYDCIIIRHAEEGFTARAIETIDKFGYKTKIINAGEGTGQHPVFALIDWLTIYRDFGRIDGLSAALAGDLLNSRVVHSLAYLLGKFNVNFSLISPSKLKIKRPITDYFERHNIKFLEITSAEELGRLRKKIDFYYVVGVPENSKSALRIDKNFARSFFKKNTRVYHPFPRGEEIPAWRADNKESWGKSIDTTIHAGYFNQRKNSVPVCMSLFKMALNPAIDIKQLASNWEHLRP